MIRGFCVSVLFPTFKKHLTKSEIWFIISKQKQAAAYGELVKLNKILKGFDEE